MAKNSFGHLFRITSFGESHGVGLGVIIDGCPAGVDFDDDFLVRCLERRRPGRFGKAGDHLVSARKEADMPEVLSGVYQGKTLGSPIAIIVRNKNQRSKDYDDIVNEPRPGHADDTWKSKFSHVDHRGGGRTSGRETVARVMAGAVAQMYLKSVCPQFKLFAYSNQIGPYTLDPNFLVHPQKIDECMARFPDQARGSDIEKLLLNAKKEGKSYGGKLKLIAQGLPMGLGQPVFHKLKADLASALLGIGATCAVGIGDGEELVHREGAEFHSLKNSGYGGIRGGISTGEDISVELSFKPTSSVLDVAKKGRHDPCIVPRAIPVAEAMAALVFADHFLWSLTDKL